MATDNAAIIAADLTNEETIRESIEAIKNFIKPRIIEQRTLIKVKVQEASNIINQDIVFSNPNAKRGKVFMQEQTQIGKTLLKAYNLLNDCIKIITDRDYLSYALYYNIKGQLYCKSITNDNKAILEGYVYYSKANDDLRISAGSLKKDKEDSDKFSEKLLEYYQLFSQMIRDCQRTHNVKETVVNKGHISEAFEHHIASTGMDITDSVFPSLDLDTMWNYVSDAVNNRAWYTGGDVGQEQVKNLTRGNVRLSTMSSLRRVRDIISGLVNANTEAALDYWAYQAVKNLFAYENLNIKGYSSKIDNQINKIFDEIFNKYNLMIEI